MRMVLMAMALLEGRIGLRRALRGSAFTCGGDGLEQAFLA